jgi:hypothetical protein
LPVISVDSAKRGRTGNFKRPRQMGPLAGPLSDHDFLSDASGLSIPSRHL